MARDPERTALRVRPAAGTRAAGALLALGALTLLAGCFGSPPDLPDDSASSSATQPSASPSGTPSPTPTSAPELLPDGSADDNLPYFTAVMRDVWKGDDRLAGRAYIDALVAAGFDKKAMQVTSDTSTVGNQAESIQFSVLWEDQCLIGQVGPATGKPVAVVVPALAEGMCLVGETRPIDW